MPGEAFHSLGQGENIIASLFVRLCLYKQLLPPTQLRIGGCYSSISSNASCTNLSILCPDLTSVTPITMRAARMSVDMKNVIAASLGGLQGP